MYRPLTEKADKDTLRKEYKNGEKIGLVTLGKTFFFFKAGLGRYYIPYTDIQRCFRRVHLVQISERNIGGREIQVESIVIMHEGKEMAQIQFPGKKASEDLLVKIVEKNPAISTELPRKLQKMNSNYALSRC